MAGRRSSSYDSPFFFFCSFFLLMEPGQTNPDHLLFIEFLTETSCDWLRGDNDLQQTT